MGLYGTMDNVDLWIAGLLEDLVPGARVGPTFQCLLLEQFSRTRHGDRFWFENLDTMDAAKQDAIRNLDLGHVVCKGSGLDRVPPDVFRQVDSVGEMILCDLKPGFENTLSLKISISCFLI